MIFFVLAASFGIVCSDVRTNGLIARCGLRVLTKFEVAPSVEVPLECRDGCCSKPVTAPSKIFGECKFIEIRSAFILEGWVSDFQ